MTAETHTASREGLSTSPAGALESQRMPTGAHETHSTPAGSHGYTKERDAYLKRMRRIEGQVRGIERMISEDVYCIDILTQVSAVTKALQAVSLGLLEDHINHCVVNAAKSSPEEGVEKVREAVDAVARLWKS